MSKENKTQILKLVNQLIEYSVEKDMKCEDHYLFGVMLSKSWMTFHLQVLKDLIENEN